ERFGPEDGSAARRGHRGVEVALLGAHVVFDQGASEREVGGWIRIRLPDVRPCARDLLTQRVLRAPEAATGRTAHGNRAEMELQALVPVLLLCRPERERLS